MSTTVPEVAALPSAYTPLPGDDLDAEEEIRFAAVLNGGVSLAIWIGGVAHELDRLTRREGVYGDILTALRSRARVDVIGGTSAGGINGAFLAVAQSHPGTALGRLRDVWAEQASMTTLLHKPWVGRPASLMQGDDVFWPALREAFADLLPTPGVPTRPFDPADRPIELIIPTTLLHPTARTVVDSLGHAVQQPRRRGRFTFRRGASVDDFAPGDLRLLADQLALASRSTASFPVAFEPFFVPAAKTSTGGRDDGSAGYRPPMATFADFDHDRWVIDGGVLLNTPLQPVLDAIAVAPAGVQTRRVLLLVVPDPYVAAQQASADDPQCTRPEIPEVLGGIVSAWQGATFEYELGQLEQHNRAAAVRRQARTDLLENLEPAQLVEQATALWRGYRAIRLRRAALVVATPLARRSSRPVDRVTGEVVAAMSDLRQLPFVPDDWPGDSASTAAGDWVWGIAALERLAGSVLDLLRTTMWLLPHDAPAKAEVRGLREDYYRVYDTIRGFRRADKRRWADWAAGRDPAAAVTGDELAAALADWTVEGPPDETAGPDATAVADKLLEIAHEAALRIPADSPLLTALGGQRAGLLRMVFQHEELADRRHAAEALEICYVCLVDQAQTGLMSDQVVELVSVSAGIDLHLADVDQPPPGERVAGLHLGHFAAFLKQAWRINDWIWGRIEGADRLVTTLLDPVRLRRLVLLDGGDDAAADRILRRLLPDADLTDPAWTDAREALLGDGSEDIARRQLEGVVTALVTAIAESVIGEEQPALRGAAATDRAARDDRHSRAGAWLDRHSERSPS